MATAPTAATTATAAAYSSAPAFVHAAVAIVEQALERFPDLALAVAYNGGKDSTVLLVLLQLALSKRAAAAAAAKAGGDIGGGDDGDSGADSSADSAAVGDGGDAAGLGCVRWVYFTEEDVFEEQEEFLAASERRHALRLLRVGGGVKAGCAQLVAEHGVRAFLMGTRRSDPYAAELEPFAPSTAGWATCMRVNPVLDWSFEQVWSFIRLFGVNYCALYDRGFTSVGQRANSQPNEQLRNEDGSYRPASELRDAASERAGRDSSASSN